jgi:hypothetical protein
MLSRVKLGGAPPSPTQHPTFPKPASQPLGIQHHEGTTTLITMGHMNCLEFPFPPNSTYHLVQSLSHLRRHEVN